MSVESMESLRKELVNVSQPEDYFCPICAEVLTEPFLTDCGHHVCRKCHGRMRASGKTECPVCRHPRALVSARLNKHLQRQVYNLQVLCKHHEEGCKWKGEFRNLRNHLDPAKRNCNYVHVPCSFGCGERVECRAMKEHKKHQCRKRPCTCKYCGYHSAYDVVTENHYPICRGFPVECPNKCKAEGLKRCELNKHVSKCPLQVIPCPYSSIGCTVRLPRKEIETHEQQALRQHRLLALKLNEQTEEVNTPDLCASRLFNLPPTEFTITGYLKWKVSGKIWTSPPFLTHPQGYKMCLKLRANDRASGKNSHVSVSACLMRGEHDEELQWPLECDIVVELLNWRKDEGHREVTLVFNNLGGCGDRVMDTDIGNTFSESHLIYDSSLPYNPIKNTEYLQDDCLRLRLQRIFLYSTPLLLKTPNWRSDAPSSSLCEFTVTHFTQRKVTNNTHCSPAFYTHSQGYKMSLQIQANGRESGKGTHISVSVCPMRGEYDDKLQLPFEGDVVIELLNWRENKGHHVETVTISQFTYDSTQVVNGRFGAAHRFISHSLLSRNCTTNTEYLQDDCLRLRVKTVAIYSTSYLHKAPAWMHPLATVQPLCEFTVTGFSKRKHFSSIYLSPSFYTHASGYKLCLCIYANGNSSGKGTHVSISSHFMKGEHDNQLQWPFQGDIIIELLNWREDREHHTATLASYHNPFVHEAIIGELHDSTDLISYLSLSYNPNRNTEYIQDDCLRLRVKEAIVYYTPLTHKSPTWQRHPTTSQPLCEHTVTEFSKRKVINSTYYSPPFYTHRDG